MNKINLIFVVLAFIYYLFYTIISLNKLLLHKEKINYLRLYSKEHLLLIIPILFLIFDLYSLFFFSYIIIETFLFLQKKVTISFQRSLIGKYLILFLIFTFFFIMISNYPKFFIVVIILSSLKVEAMICNSYD